MSAEREVIFEFLRVGAAMKVTAVDAATGTEVSMIGDPNAGQEMLRRLAKQKLDYVMNRKPA
ncbi:MAG TPA: hypothetical protein VG328_10665 [Stellaceae bacterium]|jgi:hypothetical protein|nr:hypothetical protein [Stellaceae bacterium]